MGGLGAATAGAGPACEALADRLDGLLATTLPARGLFHTHPFNLNVAGGFSSEIARECFAEADLVIAVGASLARHNADGGKLWPQAKLLQIDIAPASLVQGRKAADAVLRADARLGVEALLDGMEQRPCGMAQCSACQGHPHAPLRQRCVRDHRRHARPAGCCGRS